MSVLCCCFPPLWVAWTLLLINSQKLGQPQAMPPALPVKTFALDWRDSQRSDFIHPPCCLWTLAALTWPHYTHTQYTQYTQSILLAHEHTERSLKINANMQKQDERKHKLHTRRAHARAHTHKHGDTQTQNTPPGLASAFNYQTDRGEIKTLTHQVGKGEQGSQAVPEAYTRTQTCTHTRRHAALVRTDSAFKQATGQGVQRM